MKKPLNIYSELALKNLQNTSNVDSKCEEHDNKCKCEEHLQIIHRNL